MKRPLTRRETLAHLNALIHAAPADGQAESATFLLRLKALRDLVAAEDHTELTLAQIHSALFPGLKPESRRSTFSHFRTAITKAAEAIGHEFSLIQPPVRGKSASQIPLHFEGRPLPDQRETLTTLATDRLDQITQAQPRIVPDVIRIFISFANDDATKAEELKKLLEATWGERRSHRVSFWIFNNPGQGGILAGENNLGEIRKAIASCPLALFLLSPSFTKSKFIAEHELPAYFPDKAGKHPVFVNLRNSKPPAAHLPAALLSQFVFSQKEKSYDEMRDLRSREQFAAALNDHIELLCRKHFGPPGVKPEPITKQPEPRQPKDLVPANPLDFCEVAARYHRGEQGVDAVADLVAWAKDPDRAHYFALLGETGAGKSTTALLFARAINEDQSRTRAYLFDLRYANYDGLLERTLKRPTLGQLIEAILRRHNISDLTPADYLRAVREEEAVLIFDGLDEVFVSLNASEQDSLMHQLLQALPIEAARRPGAGKLLFACRTQYFRSNEAERGGLTLHGREGLDFEEGKRASFELARMLPFTEEQIRTYFTANLPFIPFDEIWSLLEKIHELRELATHPYLLDLIRKQIPALNAKVERNETIRAVDLYSGFISDWSHERNRYHNVIQPEDKNELMELLAVDMWRQGRKALPARDMERWLLDALVLTPRWQLVYADLLKPQFQESLLSDFRTASFVSRWEGDTFRFAHTSLQEYFLALHLARALESYDLGTWDLPTPSPETFDFLGQHLLSLTAGQRNKALAGLARLLGDPGNPEDSRLNALRYLRLAHAKSLPVPDAPALNASGLDLTAWKFHGTAERPLVFGETTFAHSILLRASFEHVRFHPGMDFQAADLRSTLFYDCPLPTADLRACHLDGVFFRECDLDGLRLDERGLTANVITHLCPGSPWSSPLPPAHPSAHLAHGHPNGVNYVAFSPDGRFILSGSTDQTLKLWDAASGASIRTFEGHQDWVTSVAFSPDGRFVLSGSDDSTLRLWDAASGACISSFVGHEIHVTTVAFSRDGCYVLSGSADHTLNLWDAASGALIRSFVGHSDCVNSVSFSPDGLLVISGAEDNTLKLWDAATGECIRTSGGQPDCVRSVTFSPDGRLILSGSEGNTLKLWDTASGACLRTFAGHRRLVTSVTFSPDGQLVLSGSWDNTLKLWDIDTGACIKTFARHCSMVSSANFSPDGRFVVSGSNDDTLKLWDSASGACIRTIEGHQNWLNIATLSPDGRFIAGNDILNINLCCWDIYGIPMPPPENCSSWFDQTQDADTNLELIGNSVIRLRSGDAILREILPLPGGQTIVREPWDAEEATKPYHEIRWKFTRGPKDAWRWCHVVDPETNAIHPPELAAVPGAFSGPEVGPL